MSTRRGADNRIHLTGAWMDVGRSRPLLEKRKRVAPLLDDIESAHAELVRTHRKETAAADAIKAIQAEQLDKDSTHDGKARGSFDVLTAFGHWEAGTAAPPSPEPTCRAAAASASEAPHPLDARDSPLLALWVVVVGIRQSARSICRTRPPKNRGHPRSGPPVRRVPESGPVRSAGQPQIRLAKRRETM